MIKDPYELIQYLNLTGIPFRERGDQIDLQYCPYCEHGKKGNFTHFSFHKHKHVFNCMKCGTKGNLYRFKLDRGDIEPVTRARNIEYKRPKEDNSYQTNQETFYGYYAKTRGIAKNILEKFKVGHARKEIKGDKHLVFVYEFRNEKNELINRKYRSEDKKHMWTEKDAEKGYYGLQFIDFTKEYLHICEGEDDCHALAQMGFDNVVSVPYGAGNYTPAMDNVNQQFKKLILLFDNDERGQQGSRQFAEKAGLIKCWNVVLPFKDARECLQNGIEFFGIQPEIEKAKQFRHSSIIKVGDARESFRKFVFNSEKLIGRMTPSADFNKVVGGIRMSELTIITGHSGHGKTTFANNYAAWAEKTGLVPMIFAFENKFESIVRKYIEIYSHDCIYKYDHALGKMVVDKDEAWLDEWIDTLNSKQLYFLNKAAQSSTGHFDMKQLASVLDYACKFYNVNVFILDHFHYFLKLGNAQNPWLVMDEAVRQIKRWTDEYNIHIVLITHPHKVEENRNGKPAALGMNSSKGTSAIFQEADNYFVVSKPEKKKDVDENEHRCKLTVLKNREIGNCGDVYFKVLPNKNTFVPIDKPVEDTNKPKEEAVQQEVYWNK